MDILPRLYSLPENIQKHPTGSVSSAKLPGIPKCVRRNKGVDNRIVNVTYEPFHHITPPYPLYTLLNYDRRLSKGGAKNLPSADFNDVNGLIPGDVEWSFNGILLQFHPTIYGWSP